MRKAAVPLFFAPLFFLLPWQQTVAGDGNVIAFDPTARPQSVDAPMSGRVKKWFVMDGQSVKKDQPLVEISDVDEMYLQRLEQKVEAARLKLDAAKEKTVAYEQKRSAAQDVGRQLIIAATKKIESATQKREANTKKKLAVAAKLRAADQNLSRTIALAEKGIASVRDKEIAIAKQAELSAELLSIESLILEGDAQIAIERSNQLKAKADLSSKTASINADIQEAKSSIGSAVQTLTKQESALSRQEQQIILAPAEGIVHWVEGHEGGAIVKSGEQLLTIVPSVQRLAAELSFGGNDVPLLSTGDVVRLQFEGWPALALVGIPNAQPGTFPGKISIIDPMSRKQDGKIRVIVQPLDDSPWPRAGRLRQGMRVRGWAVLGRVSMAYELWRRVNGFPVGMGRLESSLELKKEKGKK